MAEIGSIVLGLLMLSLLFFEHPDAEKRGRFNYYIWTIASMVCIFGWVILWKSSTLTDFPSYIQHQTKEVTTTSRLIFTDSTHAYLTADGDLLQLNLATGLAKPLAQLPQPVKRIVRVNYNPPKLEALIIDSTMQEATLYADLEQRTVTIEKGAAKGLFAFYDSIPPKSIAYNQAFNEYSKDVLRTPFFVSHPGRQVPINYPSIKLQLDSLENIPVLKNSYLRYKDGSMHAILTWQAREHEIYFNNEGTTVIDDKAIKIRGRDVNGWVSQISFHEMNGLALDTLTYAYFPHHPVIKTKNEYLLLGKDLKRQVRFDVATFDRLDSAGFISNLSQRLSDYKGNRKLFLETGIWILLFGLPLFGVLALFFKTKLGSTQYLKQGALIFLAISVPTALFFARAIFA